VTVNVLFFGVLQDMFHTRQMPVHLADRSDICALLLTLESTFKSRPGLRESLAVAVNREYRSQATILHHGDEVALLPPVSGGNDAG
jgi:molybdopterin converting factor small subunit